MNAATQSVSPRSAGPLSGFDPGSYRDRDARVFHHDSGVYRVLSPQAVCEWESLASKVFFRRAVAARQIVRTERVDPADLGAAELTDAWAGVLRHEAIPYVSYPYEWCFGMLRDAALLYLDLLDAALAEGMVLKDGSAFNIQWRGAEPAFIDVPSFRTLEPGEPWPGYRQFCQLFLYPLFLQAYKNVDFQPWLRGRIDGIEPGQCSDLMSLRDLFRPGVFAHVYLHAKLVARYARRPRSTPGDLRAAGFDRRMIRANVSGLSRIVRRLRWEPPASTWSDYATSNSYTEADRLRKESFVRQAVAARPRGLVWELGSNTGAYSRIAAEHADYVVALDNDHLAIEHLYRALRSEKRRSILPLVWNVTDPSPPLGWRGGERRTVLERGRPDLTLCLAFLHHAVIAANIPLREFLDWLAGLGGDLVIEFVTKEDPMVQALLRSRRDLYSDYDPLLFERWLAERFEVVRRETLGSGTRTLYHAAARA